MSTFLLSIFYDCHFIFDEEKKNTIFHIDAVSKAKTNLSLLLFTAGNVCMTDFPNGLSTSECRKIVYQSLCAADRDLYKIVYDWSNHLLLSISDQKHNATPKSKNAKWELIAKEILPDDLFFPPLVLKVVIFPKFKLISHLNSKGGNVVGPDTVLKNSLNYILGAEVQKLLKNQTSDPCLKDFALLTGQVLTRNALEVVLLSAGELLRMDHEFLCDPTCKKAVSL